MTITDRLSEMAKAKDFACSMLDGESEAKNALLADAQLLRSAANFRDKLEELISGRINAAEVKDDNHQLATELREIREAMRRL